jgi:hypothetical protein
VDADVQANDPAGRLVGSAHTDQLGRYTITLPAGTYTLHIAIHATFPRCPDTRITVVASQPNHVDITCDTGIR